MGLSEVSSLQIEVGPATSRWSAEHISTSCTMSEEWVVGIIQVMLSPTSGPEQKQQANNQLMEFERNDANLLVWPQLINNSNATVQFFGYKYVQTLIEKNSPHVTQE